jgi:uncharacterized membrane protein YvbJ
MKDSQLVFSFLDDKEDLLKILKKKTKKSKKLIYSIIFFSILIIIVIFFCILFCKRKNNQLERFYNSIPASLKSDSNGNFNLDRSGFNTISNSNKLYKARKFYGNV